MALKLDIRQTGSTSVLAALALAGSWDNASDNTVNFSNWLGTQGGNLAAPALGATIIQLGGILARR